MNIDLRNYDFQKIRDNENNDFNQHIKIKWE